MSISRINLVDKYGPWAVITGASSGIGLAYAQELAACGFNLVLVARRKELLVEISEKLASENKIQAVALALDLSKPDSKRLLEAGTENVDVGLFVASAGFGTSGSFLDSDQESEVEMLSVNCRALMETTHLFARRFAAKKRGGIILLSSIVGFQGMSYAATYAASKAYVLALAEGLHYELAPLGVDVVAAAPGPTESGFAERSGMRMGQTLKARDTIKPVLAALGKTETVLPGALSKLLVYSLAPLPRWARVRIMGGVMYGMTKHKGVKQ